MVVADQREALVRDRIRVRAHGRRQERQQDEGVPRPVHEHGPAQVVDGSSPSLREPPGLEERPRPESHEVARGRDRDRWHRVDPAEEGQDLALLQRGATLGPDEGRGLIPVAARDGVRQRIAWSRASGEHAGGLTVKTAALSESDPREEPVAEEAVNAVPITATCDETEACLVLQDGARGLCAGDRRARRLVRHPEDGQGREHVAHHRVEPVDHLVGEIVDDIGVAAEDVVDRGGIRCVA